MPLDLAFEPNSKLRGVAEVDASEDGRDKFTSDFVAAWVAVMNRDRPLGGSGQKASR